MRNWLCVPLLIAAAPLLAQEGGETDLGTITVLGAPEADSRVVGSAHLVERETLEAFGYDDINRVLNLVPGLYLREEDGYGLRPNIGLRGANSDRSQKVTLLEDGVLFGPAPYSAPAAYFFPLTARMVGVEVFKGPAAIQHGPQTIGGAINLISAPIPSAAEGLIAVDGGSDAYRRAHVRAGGPLGGAGVLGEVVHLAADGFKRLDGGGDTGFVKNEVLIKAGHALGDGRIELRLGYADEVSDETYLGLTEADFRADPLRRYRASQLDRMDWDWNSVRLDVHHPALGGRLAASAYSHQFERAWRKFNNFRDTDIRDVLANPDAPSNRLRYQALTGEIDSDPQLADDDLLVGTNDREFRSSGVQARLHWQLEAGTWQHAIEAGARVHSDRIARLHDELAYDMLDGQLVRNGAERQITADNTARATAVALWLRDELRYGRWTLAPGLRAETVATDFVNRGTGSESGPRSAGARNDDRYSVVLPGLGVNFAQTPSLNWLAGVHQGFSPGAPGLEDVEPEEAINAEAGLRWASPIGRLELIGFYSDYSNLTAVCAESSGCRPEDIGTQTNAGEVRVGGVEASWSRDFAVAGAMRLPLSASYTLTRGELREAFESTNPQFGSVEPGDELPYVPEHRANAVLGLVHPRWAARLSATYVSAMRDAAGTGAIVGGSDRYTVLDLAAGWGVSEALHLSARVDNVLDEEYVVARRPFGARPGKPLSGSVGIEYRF